MASKYIQRDLVWLKHNPPLPDGSDKDHPVIIISHDTANSIENFYTGVMVTGANNQDKFSFPLLDEMFEAPLKKANTHVRLYITVSFREDQVKAWGNRMFSHAFKHLLDRFKNYVII